MNNSQKNVDNFEDPLENYEPKQFDDPLEQALVEEEVGNIRHEPFKKISPDIPIHEAIDSLAQLHISCLLVEENNKLIGVLSERDVLNNVALNYDEVRLQPVRNVMTTDPIYVFETDSAVAALSVMAICGYRHVPIVDLNDNLTGIISPKRLVEFLKKHF